MPAVVLAFAVLVVPGLERNMRGDFGFVVLRTAQREFSLLACARA
jgi:hypothetical protein